MRELVSNTHGKCMAQESGNRFARDMRRVRESRRIAVEDLHEETKIPVGLLEAFEETALFDHPQFNRVYLRSFVRTYANVIGIDPDVALEALEEALSDRYAGSLGVEYLDDTLETADMPPATSESPEVGVSEGREETDRLLEEPADRLEAETKPSDHLETGIEPSDRLEARDKPRRPIAGETTRGMDSPGDVEKGQASSEKIEEPASPSLLSTTGTVAAGYDDTKEQGIDDESEWTIQSPPQARKRAGRAGYRDRPGEADWRWIGGIAAVIVVGVVVWIVLSVTGGDPSAVEQTPAAIDTTSTADTAIREDTALASRPAMPVIGDTLNVQVVAANDKVDPIRVTVDDDLRRPYWIEIGDSMMFRPMNRIVFEEDLDDIALSIEGAEYPTNRRDELGRIVITRDSLRAYFRANGAE